MTIEGRVTGVEDGALHGWLAAAAGDDAGYVEALIEGGGPFGRAQATPGEDGRLHFAIPIPDALRDGQMRFLDVRPLGSDRPLDGGPVIYDGGLFDAPVAAASVIAGGPEAPFLVEGRVEFTAPDMIQGWAWAPDEPRRRLQVEIVAGGRLVAQITADKPLDELKTEGVGDGRYGFRVDLSRLLRRGPHDLIVRVAGFHEPLLGGVLRVGPFAADGEVDCPGYLDDAATRSQLATLPFEHLAFNAQRIAPERLAPRLINRLRRERMSWTDRAGGGAVLVVLPGGDGAETSACWALQSYPRTARLDAAAGPAAIRAQATGGWVFFAAPGDLLHPSAATIVAGLADTDAVHWARFVADEPRAGSAGALLRRPPFDPLTARHGAITDTTLAVKSDVLAAAPDDVLAALTEGRLHPLWFWLAGQNLRWKGLAEALTSRVGEAEPTTRETIEADAAIYRRLLADEGAERVLQGSAADLPFPCVLVPARRAAEISVLVSFRDRAALTLRCIHSIARQRLSGELELVLVDNQSAPGEAAAVIEGARRLLGEARVTALAYDAAFSHSAQNNLAARAARGEAIVFCNNDVVLSEPTLLEQLAAWALEPGIGAVGCRLEDPERGIGSYGHVFSPPSADPYQPLLRENADPTWGRHVHACAGITLALGAMHRDRFLALGGLDEVDFPIGYNDIDLMLRATRAGLTHLYLGHLDARHARGSSRTGDNEDMQAFLIRERYPEAGLGYLHQLARERIETARPDLRRETPAVAIAPETGAEDAELIASLQSALDARRALEARRAELARALLQGSDLLSRLGDELTGGDAAGKQA